MMISNLNTLLCCIHVCLFTKATQKNQVGQPLSLTSLPANVSQVRLTWAASSAVIFVGALFGSREIDYD